MKIGVTIPNSWGVEDVSEVIRLGQLAEELGYAFGLDHGPPVQHRLRAYAAG